MIWTIEVPIIVPPTETLAAQGLEHEVGVVRDILVEAIDGWLLGSYWCEQCAWFHSGSC